MTDYLVSLIVIVPDTLPKPKQEKGIVDEIIYVDSLGEARQKQEELKKRKTSNKRRIIIASSIQDARNFSEFK